MNEPIVALPGFTVPSTPNLDALFTALPDGTIVWDVLKVDDKDIVPPLSLYLASDYGGVQTRRLVLDPKQVSLTNVEGPFGTRVVRATISARALGNCEVEGYENIQIEPGSYRLLALLHGVQVAQKWVVLEAGVANAAWIIRNKLCDQPISLKPDTTP